MLGHYRPDVGNALNLFFAGLTQGRQFSEVLRQRQRGRLTYIAYAKRV